MSSQNQGEPGHASNSITQSNPDGLASITSFSNFIPIGGDGPPSTSIGGRTYGQGLSATTTVSSDVVDNEENNTRRVRGSKLEQEQGVGNLTSGFDHKIFEESPYQFYVQKPGSDGAIFTPYMQPVQPHNLGRTYNNQGIRYHCYHLETEKPPDSWRMGIVGVDVVAADVDDKIDYMETPEINAYGVDNTPAQ